ncbi:signal peptide peptidase SppA [Methylomonas paludis]|uniref:Signal peptide peptidase SppA n=1 Tax=Methylomonas paludis TaxID=1173101 RepID=A0A975R961_9GAMM|nr:signal peptide peptidase SppA [Methylomonas paludis]QWF71105.1 signal peptide peptidase SppA [Methylomonas paludis]
MTNHQDQEQHAETQASGWERQLIENLALAALQEQKKARRWGIFFKLLAFGYLSAILAFSIYPEFSGDMSNGDKKHVAIVDVHGVIGEDSTAKTVIAGLQDAVKDKNTLGVILSINSPGGSPVESAYIYEEIKRLKKLHPDLPFYSVVADICASGGYYVAAASDKIYVSQSSLIGSIGVIMNGFGFTNVMDKLGIERRLLTAGTHKALLDPFSPVKKEEALHMQTQLDEVHQQFITAIRESRGDRIKAADAGQLFSGLVWAGTDGVKLGLADDFGSIDSVARDVLGTEQKVNFTPQEHLLDRLAGKLGASFGHSIGSMLKLDGLN